MDVIPGIPCQVEVWKTTKSIESADEPIWLSSELVQWPIVVIPRVASTSRFLWIKRPHARQALQSCEIAHPSRYNFSVKPFTRKRYKGLTDGLTRVSVLTLCISLWSHAFE